MLRRILDRATSLDEDDDDDIEFDRYFSDVTRVDYLPEDRSAELVCSDGSTKQIDKGVYKVETGDGVFLESALAENWSGSSIVVTLDVHPSCGVVNAHFNEVEGSLELFLAE